MIAAYLDLFALSVRQPDEAARRLFAMNLSRDTLWSGLALAAVLNALIYVLSLIVFPPPGPMVAFLSSPLIVLITLASVLVITVFGLFWAGRAMGGKGRFADVLIAITWLQYMRLGVQFAALVLMFVSPGLASLAVIAAGLYGVYILVHFLNAAHRFEALSKAFFLIVLTALGMIIGLSLFLSVVGAAAMGLS